MSCGHQQNPVKGYHPCAGCEIESLRARLHEWEEFAEHNGLRIAPDTAGEDVRKLRAEVEMLKPPPESRIHDDRRSDSGPCLCACGCGVETGCRDWFGKVCTDCYMNWIRERNETCEPRTEESGS